MLNILDELVIPILEEIQTPRLEITQTVIKETFIQSINKLEVKRGTLRKFFDCKLSILNAKISSYSENLRKSLSFTKIVKKETINFYRKTKVENYEINN